MVVVIYIYNKNVILFVQLIGFHRCPNKLLVDNLNSILFSVLLVLWWGRVMAYNLNFILFSVLHVSWWGRVMVLCWR